MVYLYILEIMAKNTDYDHRLTIHEIAGILKRDYNYECSERTIRRDLLKLQESGLDIEGNRNGFCILSRKFDESELRMLIDGVIFSKHIPPAQAKSLIDKLSSLASKYFDNGIKDIEVLSRFHNSDNKQIFYNIDVISEAIERDLKIEFIYNIYDTKKQLVPKRPEPYLVNPYKLAAANGNYYLICNYDKYDNISHFRIDRITDIKLTDQPQKSRLKVSGMKTVMDLPTHMVEHLYMFSGEAVLVRMCVDKSIMSAMVDWFGKDFEIYNEIADKVFVKVRVNQEALCCWAMQYGDYVEVLTPDKLRRKMALKARSLMEKYWQN